MTTRLTGTVTAYDRVRRYGYIQSLQAPDKKFFFHKDDVYGDLPALGATVEFIPNPTAPRGPRAGDVRRHDDPASETAHTR